MSSISRSLRRGLLFLATAVFTLGPAAADPLRIFIRGGLSNRGRDVHAHPRFLEEWTSLLTERGATTTGGMDWPTAEQIKDTDVIVAYAQEGGDATPEQEALINDFVKRGGGLVVIHTASVSFKNPPWWKSVIGGSWVPGKTKWREGPMDLYYVENQRIENASPITRGASNFHLDDEIYYDMDVSPDVRVLATSYTPNVLEGRQPAEGNKPHIYDIQPQMWTYERTAEGGTQPYRAFVSIPGHLFKTFALPHYRAVLLRGIAWAGKRPNLDEFCKPEEISSLTYPEGGPQKPADTLAHLEIHPDFNLTLVATEPLITKPMNFDWDPAGRLWVAETPEYPNGRRGMRPDYRGREWKDHGGIDPTPGEQSRPGRDKISILIDTDGDGVMDKKEIFYEGLDLVTGLVFHQDGVIVTQAPDILFLRDTDHDGKADKVEKLYTNLGTGDTHAVINNPRWGWDGWIYATHGYSASDRVLNAKGEKQPGIGSGVVRFKADGSAIEQYSSKGGNTWGLEITGDNRVMWTQPTSGTILEHVVLPEYALARGKAGNTPSFNVVIGSPKSWPAMTWEQMAYVQIDLVGSFTATAGCVIYDGGSWPAEYHGDYFTTEPTINIVHHERLTPKGSSYIGNKLPGREDTEFIRSKDMWWRPIEVRVGPDGAVYIGDFYNQAVIHNDTRGPDHNRVNAAVRPDRDHYFGRIWRLDHKQAKKLEVPDLSKADVPTLVKAIEHPNRHVRMNAARLLLERPNPVPPRTQLWKEGEPEEYAAMMERNFGYQSLLKLALDPTKPAEPRVAALWILGRRDAEVLMLGFGWEPALADKDPVVRRNAALLAELPHYTQFIDFFSPKLVPLLEDGDPSVRLAALRALGSGPHADEVAHALIAAWPRFDDDFQKSAAIGAASRNPAASIAAALDAPDTESLLPLISNLVNRLADANDTAAAAKLVTRLAAKPATADAFKRSILDTLRKGLADAPAMTPDLSAALSTLLASGASGSVLPLAAKWDTAGKLKDEITRLTTALLASFGDAARPDADRITTAQSLLGLRSTNDSLLPAVVRQLAGTGSPAFKQGLVSALGETGDPAVGPALAAAYGSLPVEVQGAAFDTLLRRADWTMALLDAVNAKTVDPTAFGPANAYRLRTHPAKEVADRATAMKDALNPNEKAKNEIIATLAPIVSQPGNAATGKTLFTVTCATCHQLGTEGKAVGPTLTGMGAHGPAELLVHIVDPNREVDPSFHAWNIETTDGQFQAGVIARQNNASVLLRNVTGEVEIPTSKIKSRVDTGRSLMPEGFDALGGEMLRDILAYMCGDEASKFRILDLGNAYTADGRRGIFSSQDQTDESVRPRKFGTFALDGIPFFFADPGRTVTGRNLIVLQGGPEGAFARSFPPRVEVPVGVAAQKLHLLSGVGGWAWPYGGGEAKGKTALTVTLTYADGSTEDIDLKNGIEFADYIGDAPVPGSKAVPNVTRGGQLRWITLSPKNRAVIKSVAFASPGNLVAPVIVAATAELTGAAGASAPASKPTAAVPTGWGKGKKALLVGGGSSHDYQKWFNDSDSATLQKAGFATRYTESVEEATALIAEADVVVYSTNQAPFGGLGFQAALRKAADAGTGFVILHPGLWYNFGDNQDYNRTFVGGGSRGHDALGEFTVKITKAQHPIVAGLGDGFAITDELYYAKLDPAGSPSEVLATATSPKSGQTFPSVWTVRHAKAKIACLAAGHDGRVHELPAFQKLLVNAATWAAK